MPVLDLSSTLDTNIYDGNAAVSKSGVKWSLLNKDVIDVSSANTVVETGTVNIVNGLATINVTSLPGDYILVLQDLSSSLFISAHTVKVVGDTYYIRSDGSVTSWANATDSATAVTSANLAFYHANYGLLPQGTKLKLSGTGSAYLTGETINTKDAMIHVQGNELNLLPDGTSPVILFLAAGSYIGVEVTALANNCFTDLSNVSFFRASSNTTGQFIHATGTGNFNEIKNVTISGINTIDDNDCVSLDGDTILRLSGKTDIQNIKNSSFTNVQALTTHSTSRLEVRGELLLKNNNLNMTNANDSFIDIRCFGTIFSSKQAGAPNIASNSALGDTYIEAVGGQLIIDNENSSNPLIDVNFASGKLTCKNLDFINVSNTINAIVGTCILDGCTFDNIPFLRLNGNGATPAINIKPGTIINGGGSYNFIDPTVPNAVMDARPIIKVNGQTVQLIDFTGGLFDTANTTISGMVIDCSQGLSWNVLNNALFTINQDNIVINNLIIIGKPGFSMGRWLFDIRKDNFKAHNIILHNCEFTDSTAKLFRDTSPLGNAELSHFVFSGTTMTDTENTLAKLQTAVPNSLGTTYTATDSVNNDYQPTDNTLLSGGYSGPNIPNTVKLQNGDVVVGVDNIPFGSYK